MQYHEMYTKVPLSHSEILEIELPSLGKQKKPNISNIATEA